MGNVPVYYAIEKSSFCKITVTCNIYIITLCLVIFGIVEKVRYDNGWVCPSGTKNPIVGNCAVKETVTSAPQKGRGGSCAIGNHRIIAGNIGAKCIDTGKGLNGMCRPFGARVFAE